MYSSLKSAIRWGSHANSPVASKEDMCEMCGRKPKYIEKGFKHPYCSRTCARGVQGNQPIPCAFYGCRATGLPAHGGFCSEIHVKDALKTGQLKACDQCRSQPRTVGPLCAACDRRGRGPRLRELDTKDVKFGSVVSQFTHEWQGSRVPVVEKILEVSQPRDARSRFEAYKMKLDSTGSLRELRTYHSSQCICDLGVRDSKVCDWKSCGICNIVKSSFAAFAFGVPQNSGRYGDGIYSYLNPALADKFATASSSSPYRASIACDVLVGKDGKQVEDGERVFVPTANAMIPSYILLYKV